MKVDPHDSSKVNGFSEAIKVVKESNEAFKEELKTKLGTAEVDDYFHSFEQFVSKVEGDVMQELYYGNVAKQENKQLWSRVESLQDEMSQMTKSLKEE